MKRLSTANWQRRIRQLIVALGIALALAGSLAGGSRPAAAASWSSKPVAPGLIVPTPLPDE